MNKQQLATRIWSSANQMRSKIEANEYKDYILGFIFYKFLSEKEEEFLRKQGWEDSNLELLIDDGYNPETISDVTRNALSEEEKEHLEYIEFCQKNIGYFISYKYLFSTWLKEGNDFDVSEVRDGLNSFNRLISKNYSKVYEKIFDTLQTGLSKLGDSSSSQTNAINQLINLIKDIPMDNKQGYDVLGYIYEYLISNFAANAGKKAGEFYTPHEVSILMSEIVANHLKDKKQITIYDPTSGSGSLLINIGKSISKYMDENSKDNIAYYAQELKDNTYNLTRMNLIMRGILPNNINCRCGDTLEDDWPYFDDKDREATYKTLYLDAVVSNPPYSQNWNPENKENDPRYAEYGLAPKSKADYAFLLHDLYHLKPDGIMTIVLPHGVLFRGGEEEKIRKNLIENNKIDTIIGLPANIFFGTGIPTIIMVLKQKRTNDDILIIDASKGFIKEGNQNKLRACDIKKIVDCIKSRSTIDKFSKLVSKDEVRKNEYNLNIPRYVDSNENNEHFDIYSTIYGGISLKELDTFKTYWDEFPSLKNELFSKSNEEYVIPKSSDFKSIILNNEDVKKYISNYKVSLNDFDNFLKDRLIENLSSINYSKEEEFISNELFKRLNQTNLINAYKGYEALDNEWKKIENDLEIIQTEGYESIKQVDPNMVIKNKKEVQDGYKGHVIPFELIQEYKFKEDKETLDRLNNELEEINSEYSEIFESIDEEDKSANEGLFNDDKTEFKNSSITKYVKSLKNKEIEEDSFDFKMKEVGNLIEKEKKVNSSIKEVFIKIQEETINATKELTDLEIKELLFLKWISPILKSLNELPNNLLNDFATKLNKLVKKYDNNLLNLNKEIELKEKELSLMLDELDADEMSAKALQKFKEILGDK